MKYKLLATLVAGTLLAGCNDNDTATKSVQAFDGAMEPLLHFLVEDQRLSKKQRQELIRILEAQEPK